MKFTKVFLHMKFHLKTILVLLVCMCAFLVFMAKRGGGLSGFFAADSHERVGRFGPSTSDGSANSGELANSKRKRKLSQFSDEELEDDFVQICKGVKGESEESILEAYIESLLERGGFKKALELITNNLGEGTTRQNLFMLLGLSPALSAEDAMAAFSEIKSQNDQAAFKGGLFQRFAGNEWNLKSVNRLLSLGGSKDENAKMLKIAFLYGLKVKGAGGQEPVAYLSSRLSQISELEGLEDVQKNELKNLLLKLTAEVDPFEAMAKTSSLGKALDPSIQNEMIATMLRRDPARSLEVLLNNQDVGDAIQVAFRIMAKSDLASALSMYEQKSSAFSASQKEQAVAAFSRYYSETGNWDQANIWTSRISDQALKKTVEGQVWTAQRDALRKEVASDPSGTMQSIVTGQSKYTDYWIEEAMGTWVAKDFDKAQEWYQKNWNSMPANKAQYLAAAFANQATEQGDTATARQWAGHIQDAKTKQRIEAGIAKAEAAKSK